LDKSTATHIQCSNVILFKFFISNGRHNLHIHRILQVNIFSTPCLLAFHLMLKPF
jgi:hypothetical protein